MQHVFLVGAKSLGAYGGYETFINKLTEYHQSNPNIKYHVAVKANGQGASVPDGVQVVDGRYTYHNSDCFQVKIPEKLGPAQAIYYDCAALKKSIEIIKDEGIEHPIVYIMTCRIGPFFNYFCRAIHKLGGRVFLNPDGHEWKRAKWSAPVRKYWKYSEKVMVCGSDLVVCDSKNIEKYIQQEYGVKNTTFIAYGAETEPSKCNEEKYEKWVQEKGLRRGEYYLIVGRFVPENNYETMIKEYMKSKTNKDFAIITNANPQLQKELEEKLGYQKDQRIKFVGTVYDQELLKKIREEAYGYFHGHEVGGTNPSLLEALGSTKLNLLLDVGFNREVAEDSALYWTKEPGNLAALIDKCEGIDREELGRKAKERIRTAYSWEFISDRYAEIWVNRDMNKANNSETYCVVLCASIYHLLVALIVVFARGIEKNTLFLLSTHEQSQYEHFKDLSSKLDMVGINYEIRLRNKNHELLGIERIKDAITYKRIMRNGGKSFHLINFSWNFSGPFRTSIYLYKKSVTAEFFEEGAMCVNTPEDRRLKKLLKSIVGIKEEFYKDKKLISINVQKPELFPIKYKEKMRKLNIEELANHLSKNDKERILKVFLDEEEVNAINSIQQYKTTIIFTQPLSEDGYIDEKKKISIYEEICSVASRFTSVVLKIHPRDTSVYSLKNVSVLLKATYPSELLLLMPIKFANAIGICTSAVVGVRADNCINLSNDFLKTMDDSFLGEMENIVFKQEQIDI